MLDHSYIIIKAFVFPFQKHLRFFFLIAAFLTIGLLFIGIDTTFVFSLAFIFVLISFLINQITHFSSKEKGVFYMAQDLLQTEIKGVHKQYAWDGIYAVDLVRISGTIYKLKLNKNSWLLDMDETELMRLEDLLESKGLIEDSRSKYYIR